MTINSFQAEKHQNKHLKIIQNKLDEIMLKQLYSIQKSFRII
jgi:hypothetical protein